MHDERLRFTCNIHRPVAHIRRASGQRSLTLLCRGDLCGRRDPETENDSRVANRRRQERGKRRGMRLDLVFALRSGCEVYGIEATKGVWWMPWHQEATKDVANCDMQRLAVREHLNR